MKFHANILERVCPYCPKGALHFFNGPVWWCTDCKRTFVQSFDGTYELIKE